MASPTSRDATRSSAGSASPTARRCSTSSSGAYTGASPAIADGRAYYGTYDNEVLAVDLKTPEDRLALQARRPQLSRSIRRRRCPAGTIVVGGRDKLVHAHRSPDRESGVDVFTPRARVDSSPVVAGGRVYVGSNDGKLYVLDSAERQEPVRVRGRRTTVRVTGRGLRKNRHRIAGREAVLSGVNSLHRQ